MTEPTFKIMTLNTASGHADWPDRLPNYSVLCADMPDILLLQEVTAEAIVQLRSLIPTDTCLYAGAEIGINNYNVILWGPRFRCLKWGAEPLPEYDAKDPRGFTWCWFEDNETQRQLGVYSIHLDHKGWTARLKGMERILNHASRRFQGITTAIGGDLNAGLHLPGNPEDRSEPYRLALDSGFADAYMAAPNTTYPPPSTMPGKPFYIDIIFVRRLIPVCMEIIEGHWSDHNGVGGDFRYHP